MDVYLIPGLGADRRLFGKLHVGDHAIHYLEWSKMPEGATLADHATKLAHDVDTSSPHVLVGVSMGGMVALEMAALTKPEKVVIISSWKGPEEMPMSIRMLRGTHPERILNKTIMQQSLPLVRWQMGVESPADKVLFNALLSRYTVEDLKVQINACLNWEGPSEPVKNLVHLHGDRDRLMPIDRIKGVRSIAGGTHFMVFSMADVVGKELHAVLEG